MDAAACCEEEEAEAVDVGVRVGRRSIGSGGSPRNERDEGANGYTPGMASVLFTLFGILELLNMPNNILFLVHAIIAAVVTCPIPDSPTLYSSKSAPPPVEPDL